MLNTVKPSPLSQFVVGRDCTVKFVKNSITNNRYRGEVYSVSFGGKKFYVQMMKLNKRAPADFWVFGYITDELTGKTIWTFPTDLWKIKNDFHGDVYTVADQNGQTCVEYREIKTGKLRRRILFSELLGVPQPTVIPLATAPLIAKPEVLPNNVTILVAKTRIETLSSKKVLKPFAIVTKPVSPNALVLNQNLIPIDCLADKSLEMRRFVREVLSLIPRAPVSMRSRW